MKKITLALFFVSLAFISFSQNKTIPGTFVFINNTAPEKEAFYKKSIEAADMEQYRLREKRVRLTFENGFEIELLSAKEIFLNNQSININNYETALAPGTEQPVFSVLDSGHLAAKVFSKSKK